MAPSNPTRAALMRDPNFRWMMGGGFISMLGDQFTLIALPWLVLQMTGDPLALGLVLAVMSVPRAVFILVGGALADRHSPKQVLMLSKYANALLLAVLAALVLSGRITMPLVYVLALGIGLASAFSIPAGSSMLPHVVAPQQLQIANATLMGMRQLSLLAGPLLAGLLIAFSGHGGGALADARGLGIAFALDCCSFVLSAWTLKQVRLLYSAPPADRQPILQAVGAGLAMAWRDRALRTCFLYWGAIALVVGGSLQVALPVLASTRLGGAAALGLLMGAHGTGTLFGMVLSGVAGRLRIGTLGATLLAVDALVGALFIPMGAISAAWQGAALMLPIGLLAGFMQVAVFSWIQRRVPREMLGRTMSIFMFIFMGLAPLSAALTGWILHSVTLAQLFAGAGICLAGGAALAFVLTPMRAMADSPPPAGIDKAGGSRHQSADLS